VSGIVQGVGFRPFIYRLAVKNKLKGYVKNLADGAVQIHVEGPEKSIHRFREGLEEPPALAEIDEIVLEETEPHGLQEFEIISSGGKAAQGVIPPDTAPCGECLKEYLDPDDRRFGYLFTSCTDCGPRYTTISGLPYDRGKTSFKEFPMCGDCREEYENPGDRRFNYKSITCPLCGPEYTLYDCRGKETGEDPVKQTVRLLAEGAVGVVKGIGGMHLVCDASNNQAVGKIRSILSRSQKPLAVMSKSKKQVKRYARLGRWEESLLESRMRPIVLLVKKQNHPLSNRISPGLHNIGVMLPYTLLHHSLLDSFDGTALVFTSANPPGKPLILENSVAFRQFRYEADFYLLHNLDLLNRCDDSVTRVINQETVYLRRSRGEVMKPLTLPLKADSSILALGPEVDNTLCMVNNDKAYLSQYIGDTTRVETQRYLKEAIRHLKKLADVQEVDYAACDMHPLYYTSRLASKYGEVEEVQHHLAHALSLMAEHGLNQEVVCITCDGAGYGLQGDTWGGEILHVKQEGFENIGGLVKNPMPGGDKAARQPMTALAGVLYPVMEESILKDILKHHEKGFQHGLQEISVVLRQLENKFNTAYSSSTGRVLDAVSALLEVCYRRTYEGEPAMKLESLAHMGEPIHDIGVRYREERIDTGLMVRKAAELLEDGARKQDIAASFQQHLAGGLANQAIEYALDKGIGYVGFTGGTAYNRHISTTIKNKVSQESLTYLGHRVVPPGDGGLSLGQAYHVLRKCV